MKKRSVSRGKSRSKSKEKPIGKQCRACSLKQKRAQPIVIRQALYRKYCGSQNHYYLNVTEALVARERPSTLSVRFTSIENEILEKQTLKSYHRASSIFNKLSQAIKLFEYHRDIPRSFVDEVSGLLLRRHHAHRLLEYQRLAKLLGLSLVQDSSTTFIHSRLSRRSFDRLIGEISSYNFSGESERQENPEKAMLRQVQDLIQQAHFQDWDNDKANYQTPQRKYRPGKPNIHFQ